MSIVSSVAKIGEALAVWLNPERKEKVILREAIAAAEELMKIYQNQPPYKDMCSKRVMELELHYRKRWLAWKDGTS